MATSDGASSSRPCHAGAVAQRRRLGHCVRSSCGSALHARRTSCPLADCCRCHVLSQERVEILRRKWSGVEEALAGVATLPDELVELAVALYAFREGLELQGLSELDESVDERTAFFCLVDRSDERPVDLDGVDVEL